VAYELAVGKLDLPQAAPYAQSAIAATVLKFFGLPSNLSAIRIGEKKGLPGVGSLKSWLKV
jgi:hypothetical protein